MRCSAARCEQPAYPHVSARAPTLAAVVCAAMLTPAAPIAPAHKHTLRGHRSASCVLPPAQACSVSCHVRFCVVSVIQSGHPVKSYGHTVIQVV